MVTPEDQKESRSEPVEGTGAQRQHPIGPEESSEGRGGLANQVRRSSASGPGSPGQGLKAEASAAPGACAAGERTWAPGPSGVQTHADRLPPLTAGFAARSALGPRGESGECAFPQGGRHPRGRKHRPLRRRGVGGQEHPRQAYAVCHVTSRAPSGRLHGHDLPGSGCAVPPQVTAPRL